MHRTPRKNNDPNESPHNTGASLGPRLLFYESSFRLHFKCYTVHPVLSGHSKKDKTKILITDGSLMEVKSIVECSLGAFRNTFDLH